MKNILITTDFSINSLQAAKFGLQIARKFNADVYFLHVFSLPIVSSEVPDYYDYSAYQEIKTKQLEKTVKNLDTENLTVKLFSIAGISFASEIEDFSARHQIDLIITGLTGASTIDELFIGSNTLHLVSHSKVPVLAIPKEFTIKNRLNFAFAFDGKEIKNEKSLQLFREISKKYSDKIYAFHVAESDNSTEMYEVLKKNIPFDEFDLKTELNDNINNGMLEYIANQQIDVLGIVPRKHSFFDRLFHESYTKEFTKYSKIPVLTIPD